MPYHKAIKRKNNHNIKNGRIYNASILQKFRLSSTRTAACTAAAVWKPARNRSSERGVPMNQSEKRQFLIHELLKEAPEFQGLSVPADSQGQKQLLRGLMNIRPSRKISPEFLEIQDSYLAAEIAVKTVENYCEETGNPIKVIFNVFKDEDFIIYRNILTT